MLDGEVPSYNISSINKGRSRRDLPYIHTLCD